MVVVASGLTGKYLLTRAKESLGERRTELSARGLAGDELERELASLRGRRSNIPSRMLAIRDGLTSALGLAAENLPFAGELIEVRRAAFPRPREEVIALIGVEHQSLPVLVLPEGAPAAAEAKLAANGRAFLDDPKAISRYLAET